MAAFDPIEFFGIGLERDIAIVRQARTRRQSSISLSSASRLHTALDKGQEWPWHAPIQRSAITIAPGSPLRLFVDITPEDSLFGPAFGPPSSSAESLRVSSNPSWTFDGAEPSSMERYLRNHERHEEIALCTPDAPSRCHKGALENPADDVHSPFDTEATIADASPPNTVIPMQRYLADAQPHERLALVLEQEDHHQQQRQTQIKPSDHSPQSGPSSISLSDGPGITDEDEGDDMMMVIKTAQSEIRKHRRARAAGQPRRHKSTKVRKRRSVSPPQGHRDKLAKRC